MGAVTAVQDDPDAPDGTWLTASSNTTASIFRCSFPSPATNLRSGAGLQEFRAWVRKVGGSGTPTATLELWENGALVATVLAATNVTSAVGQLLTATWNASLLSGLAGTNVECRITGTVGGTGGNRATIEVGAVEWNAADTAAPDARARVTWSRLAVPAAPAGKAFPWNHRRRAMRPLLVR